MNNKMVIFSLCFYFLLPQLLQAQPLNKTFDLGGKRSQETQYFLMESQLHNFELDGTKLGTDIFRLRLKYVPARVSGEKRDQYTCVQFSVQLSGTPERSIPALDNWSYVLNMEEGLGENEQVFGIDHSKFEKIVDDQGNSLPPDKTYHVYNAFIDFHGFCNLISDAVQDGNGIDNLKKIGDKIVHAAAFTEPPVNLGSNVMEGSYFKNGEITLELKGLSRVNGQKCAIVAYDSGESSFNMIVEAMPGMKVKTRGRSHYFGDMYIDLKSNWPQKVTLGEIVISETAVPVLPEKIHGVAERSIVMRNVSKEEFDRW